MKLLPSPAWVGWTAGILDGEGYVGILRINRNDFNSSIVRYYPIVEVQNTNFEMIEKLNKLWGGYYGKHQEKRGNWRNTFRWVVKSSNLINVLTHCLPYLIAKKDQAILALELQQSIIDNQKSHWGKRIPDEENVIRAEMFSRMKDLNVVGVRWESASPQNGS